MDHSSEIAICGAGPVGMALAAMLVKNGVAASQITLIDGKSLEQSVQDPRSIALSYGSRQILQRIGAWPIASTEIHQIHVSRRGHFGRTLIDRNEHQVPALGYVSRYGAIVEALARVCQQMGVQILRPMQLCASQENSDGVSLSLQTHDALTSSLLQSKILVQAEGGVFSSQMQKKLNRDYQQTALIAEVRSSAPIPHRAFERFTDEGPLALLPQNDRHSGGPGNPASAGNHAYSLVWCVKPTTAEALLALDDAGFLDELWHVFGNRLGRFTSCSQRMAFPLGLNANPDGHGLQRSIAIGNAAQTLHPVAGQGLNLGLRDAAVLASTLAREIAPASLQRFEQARRDDRALTLRLTDTMARVFTSGAQRSLAQGMLGATLGLLDAFDPAKHLLAELMMFGRR
ncbi:MAG: hypothetical protein RL748_543 [Pseudomonadota bacterium]|jgi:2-octaprenyl-6-methoxyphenol hydroxylase